MAADPEMIANTVTQMGLAFNIPSLNAIKGGCVPKKQLLIGGSYACAMSFDSQEPIPTVQPILAPFVEVLVTSAATLPHPCDYWSSTS